MALIANENLCEVDVENATLLRSEDVKALFNLGVGERRNVGGKGCFANVASVGFASA